MGPTKISGLPAHVLIVHFVVVGVPLTAALLVAAALWPAARRRLGVVLPAAALVTLASVPLATSAGEWLAKRVEPDPLVRAHTRLGDTLLPWVIGLFVVAAAVWALDVLAARAARSVPVPAGSGVAPVPRPSPLTGAPARIVLAVLALVVATGSVVQVYRIGESGSRAAWHDAYQDQPAAGD